MINWGHHFQLLEGKKESKLNLSNFASSNQLYMQFGVIHPSIRKTAPRIKKTIRFRYW